MTNMAALSSPANRQTCIWLPSPHLPTDKHGCPLLPCQQTNMAALYSPANRQTWLPSPNLPTDSVAFMATGSTLTVFHHVRASYVKCMPLACFLWLPEQAVCRDKYADYLDIHLTVEWTKVFTYRRRHWANCRPAARSTVGPTVGPTAAEREEYKAVWNDLIVELLPFEHDNCACVRRARGKKYLKNFVQRSCSNRSFCAYHLPQFSWVLILPACTSPGKNNKNGLPSVLPRYGL